MMKKIKPIALWLVALTAVAIVLLFVEADLLWKTQQNSLFLYSTLFFKQLMVVPGGMLSYLGTFFTQFFYYPWMGVVMLCVWWLLLLWLTKRTFRIPDSWNIVALIPVGILLTANMQLGYWVYLLKLQGYFFAPTIGTTAGIALLWLYRKLPDLLSASHLPVFKNALWTRIAYIVIVVLAGYPLMGVYALTTALLMAVWTWRICDQHTQNAVITVVTLLTILGIPLFYYRYVYCQTNLEDIYRTALPVFTISDSYPNYHIPYYLLGVCFLTFVVINWKQSEAVSQKTETKGQQKKPKNQKQKAESRKPVLRWAIQGVLLAALVAGVWHFWYKDDNFHHELRMQRCIEEADWEGVVAEGKKQTTEPTRAIVMMHNLALSRLGRQCDEMYNFRKGSKRSNTPLPVFMHTVAGWLINYHYGLMNECHRLCMEQGVEYGWSVDVLKYLARTAILSKEPQTARKFLDILRQTQFNGEWADHMEKLMNYPDLLAHDPETGPVTHMMHYDDIRSQGDGYVEKNLMTMLSYLDADDPYFQEQAVLAAMWTRNPHDFWERFEHYVKLHPDDAIPRIIQEAAFLFGNFLQLDFINDLPFDKSVKDNFYGFMKIMEQAQGKPTMQTRDYLMQNYGNTYYFEYFFLKDITYF